MEAIELVLRLRGRCPCLTKKIQILFFLVEVRAQYYSRFVNERRQGLRAWRELAESLLYTAYKAVKGLLLIWRYGLA
jgi:hypothetical protein